MVDRHLEPPERPAQPALAGQHAAGRRGRLERAARIPEAVLPKLRDLDPGEDRQRSARAHEVEPGGLGVAIPTETAEEAAPLGEQAGLRPRRIPPRRVGRRPCVG